MFTIPYTLATLPPGNVFVPYSPIPEGTPPQPMTATQPPIAPTPYALAQEIMRAANRRNASAYASKEEADFHFNIDADCTYWGDWVYLYPATPGQRVP